MEKTLVLIKPDAVERKLMGKIISIYENKGLNIIALKMIKPSVSLARDHYSDYRDKPFFEELINYITRGNVCALIVEGKNVISVVRKLNGATNPLEADSGTIRGQFALSKAENCVHSSDSKESAECEIKLWFTDDALCFTNAQDDNCE